VRLTGLGRLALGLEGLIELASGMGETADQTDAVGRPRGNGRVDLEAVALQEAAKAHQPLPCHALAARGIVVEQQDRLLGRAAALYPHEGVAAGVASVFLEHLDAGLIHLHDVVGEQVGTQLRDHRGQQAPQLDHPGGERGAR
jgi:hypothetical protein